MSSSETVEGLEADVADLRDEVDRLNVVVKNGLDLFNQLQESCSKSYAESARKIKELTWALALYGQHTADCLLTRRGSDCTCGLESILERKVKEIKE